MNLLHNMETVLLTIEVGLQHLQLVSMNGAWKICIALESQVPLHDAWLILVSETQSSTLISISTKFLTHAVSLRGAEI